MKLKLFQIDAFSSTVFGGNPAAVVPLEAWLDDALMQKDRQREQPRRDRVLRPAPRPASHDLRWFTPESEVDLCGHATLASAWVVFEALDPELKSVKNWTFAAPGARQPVDRGRDDIT